MLRAQHRRLRSRHVTTHVPRPYWRRSVPARRALEGRPEVLLGLPKHCAVEEVNRGAAEAEDAEGVPVAQAPPAARQGTSQRLQRAIQR